jgi:DNA-binding NtrC family response regulator
MPALRDRREDIMVLADAFRAEFNARFGYCASAFAGGVAEIGNCSSGAVAEL